MLSCASGFLSTDIANIHIFLQSMLMEYYLFKYKEIYSSHPLPLTTLRMLSWHLCAKFNYYQCESSYET